MFGDPSVLLRQGGRIFFSSISCKIFYSHYQYLQPELVASTWLNLASAIWFLVTPQPPKPSMLEVITGEWRPNSVDLAANLVPGFGATTMVINGGLECGANPANTQASANRAKW